MTSMQKGVRPLYLNPKASLTAGLFISPKESIIQQIFGAKKTQITSTIQ